ncbi:MAG: universal stress protein [Hyphomicrobiales bacterium]|nr:universal stress protein [Hyphomicrobiales bacterium]
MYKTILVATDGSELSDKAVDQAIGLAGKLGAKLVGVTVRRPFDAMFVEGMVIEVPESVRQQVLESVKATLEGLGSKAKAAGVSCETISMTHAFPWEAILEAAKQKSADLIVMASHGRRGVSALLIGSETQKVLSHGKVPVLVVR